MGELSLFLLEIEVASYCLSIFFIDGILSIGVIVTSCA